MTITDVNDQPPTYTSADTTPSVAEGTMAVDSVTVSDADTVGSYSCSLNGDDASMFECTVSGDTVTLSFNSPPDYENPSDANADNVYQVSMSISDGSATGNEIAYSVTVTCLLYTSPSPRDQRGSRMPSSA